MSKEGHHYFVYILSSRSRTLYTGVTNHLASRVAAHRDGSGSKFTREYKINRLVYFEHFTEVTSAIAREKEIKGWLRSRKVTLIEKDNPTWEDLYPSLFLKTEAPRYVWPEESE